MGIIRGTLSNISSTAQNIELIDLLPPTFVSLIIWSRDTIPRGLGFASRTAHITGTVSLAAVMVIASATLLTYVAVVYLAIALPIALLRLFPPVERRWPWGTADWPFWTVKSEGFGA